MRDRPIIYCGLAIFLGLVTFPAWRNLTAGANAKGPDPKLPTVEKQCVAPVAFMKSSHMNLLMDWRDRVVRQSRHEFVAADGKHYDMSLTSTCLKQCHGEKKEFCDRCHNYAAVSISCFNCHVDSQPVGPRQAKAPARLFPRDHSQALVGQALSPANHGSGAR